MLPIILPVRPSDRPSVRPTVVELLSFLRALVDKRKTARSWFLVTNDQEKVLKDNLQIYVVLYEKTKIFVFVLHISIIIFPV